MMKKKNRLAELFKQAHGLVTHEDIRKLRQENEETLKRKVKNL
ncbi:MAG TPA: hypothetical protein VJH04_03570 [archaeon]|nr:hypothetical protein [archaeon]